MFALQKRLYAWEIEQAKAFKLYLKALMGMFLFLIYQFVKLAFVFVALVFEKPKLRKQIAPNQFEEVQRPPIGPIGF